MTRNSFPFPFKLLNCFPFTSVEISLFIEWDTVVCFKSLLQFGFQQLRMLNTLTYSLFTDFTQLNLIALHSRTDTHTHICILTHMHQSCDSSSHASLRSFDAQNKHDDRVAKLLPVRLAATVGIVVVSVIAGASVATLLYRAGKKSLSKRQTTTWPHKQLQMLHLHAWPDAASGLVSPSPPSLTLSKLHRWTPLLFRQVTYATHTYSQLSCNMQNGVSKRKAGCTLSTAQISADFDVNVDGGVAATPAGRNAALKRKRWLCANCRKSGQRSTTSGGRLTRSDKQTSKQTVS